MFNKLPIIIFAVFAWCSTSVVAAPQLGGLTGVVGVLGALANPHALGGLTGGAPPAAHAGGAGHRN